MSTLLHGAKGDSVTAIQFDDATLEAIFGAEDAEHEDPRRLKEYFYKNKAYESLRAELPLRVLVGHKGVGKSALLKVSHLEDLDNGTLSLWITPSDVAGPLSEVGGDFNRLVEVWKNAIKSLVVEKAWYALGETADAPIVSRAIATSKDLVGIIARAVSDRIGVAHDASKATLVERFMKDKVVRVYIDDLDRGWQSKQQDIQRISALLTALRDLCGADRNIQFRLALRTDVYFLVRTSDESTDKFERNIIWLQWNNHEILVVIAKRVATYFGETVDEAEWGELSQKAIAHKLDRVIEPRFRHVGKWEKAPMHRVMLSLTRRRPRDLIKLFYGAGKQAYKTNLHLITTQNVRETFESYSNERLQDIINEFKSEMPSIDQLLKLMRPSKKSQTAAESYVFSKDQLINKLKNVRQNANLTFTNGTFPSEQNIANFLYKIDFITARHELEDGYLDRKYFDQNRLLQDQFFDAGYSWEIHPAYRWALQPDDVNAVLNRLQLVGSDERI
jgi:hypothetical protein